ncbi:MAG TPA: S53 family peptidase [Solirubrobacteraceae bacterium]
MLALIGLLVLAPAQSAAGKIAPLPESDYETSSACSAAAPGYAACLAYALTPRTAAARGRTHPLGFSRSTPITAARASEGAYGLRPADLRSAYFPGEAPVAPSTQTIAIVDAYNDLHAEADLSTYSEEFGLPECTTATGCLRIVNQSGETNSPPFPASETDLILRETVCHELVLGETPPEHRERERACKETEEAQGWTAEIATDIEVAHAVCENCSILLVESNSAQFPDLEEAEETAVKLKASEISNSWGGKEPATESQVFNDPETVITAAAGDQGYLNWTGIGQTGYFAGADYPASSPDVIAVGGTHLTLSSGAWQSETVWNEDPDSEGKNRGASGGGCSRYFNAQPWQQAFSAEVGCATNRAIADVSADADPYSGVAVYDSTPDGNKLPPGWRTIGGTSVASPIIAAMFALAGGAEKVPYPAQTLYSHLGSPLLHDVTEGGSGQCKGLYSGQCSGSLVSPLDCGQGQRICNASVGYDGPSGVGTPNGIAALEPGAPTTTKPKEESTGKSTTTTPENENRAAPGGSEGTTNTATGSGEEQANSPGTPAGQSATASTTPSGPAGTSSRTAGSVTVRLSGLALSPDAVVAIAHARVRISQLGFTFTASAPTRVRVTLSKQVRIGGRLRLKALTQALSFLASRGRNVRHFRASAQLSSGRYLLRVTTALGASRSIAFRIG